MTTAQEEFIADMEKTTRGVLIEYVTTWESYMQMYGMGAVDEKELNQGIRTIASKTENKLLNLGFDRIQALIEMAKAIKNRAELQNLYQVRETL